MSTQAEATPTPVILTKDYIRDAFKHLEEVEDVEHRNLFFKKYMVEDVKWEITGNGHELAGTRYSLAEHSSASFTKLGKKLQKPIKFVVRSIILEPDTRWACVECQGFATRTNGQPYNNDYVWLTEWDANGKIFHVRSYHDTNLAEKVLHEA
ncbi:hypothetical protein M406DRAFT_329457 [Cryphonectria parasitica EP155]|uniref:SnoaL-like domain-containing protein n=1 Tax=Cryphonectria parasitica (strain ATCC 38755 / EP155) TaxID=660469 RepID=A0A9P5CQ17_CRYP1|nr:uncharacterized protein M406DRAFT_329457 [Cryphonectria parasitica EP155]KAF3765560.1 hypothetical protein M406DRAFT_329457 [Cryphonectria parasitica EP155]